MSETEKLFKESKYQSYKFKKYFKVYDELFSLYKNKICTKPPSKIFPSDNIEFYPSNWIEVSL